MLGINNTRNDGSRQIVEDLRLSPVLSDSEFKSRIVRADKLSCHGPGCALSEFSGRPDRPYRAEPGSDELKGDLNPSGPRRGEV